MSLLSESVIKIIDQLDDKNDYHSIKNYTIQGSALEVIENIWNSKNQNVPYTIHLSNVKNNPRMIHISIVGKQLDGKWKIINRSGDDMIACNCVFSGIRFFDKDLVLMNIKYSNDIDIKDTLDNKYINIIDADFIECGE